MDIEALRAFTEVAKHASFSLAAENLYLTQPAVSKRVAQLESQLDTRLFDRVGRRITLTEVGQSLLPRAKQLIHDADALKHIVDDLSGEIRGRLRMGTSHHVGLHRLPDPLKRFTQSFPQVELDIQFMDSEAACRAVESGELEMAIVTLPPTPEPQLLLQPIWDDPLVFMLSDEHALARQSNVTFEQLIQHAAVLPSAHTYTRGILEHAVVQLEARLHVAMETNYLETLAMLVSTGLGWSLLPRTLLKPGIKEINIRGFELSRQLGVVTHKKRSLSRAAASLIGYCQ